MNNNKLHSDSYGEAKDLAYFSEFILKVTNIKTMLVTIFNVSLSL